MYEKEIKQEFDAIWEGIKDRVLSRNINGTVGSRALRDIFFARVLRMRLLSMHLIKEYNRGNTTYPHGPVRRQHPVHHVPCR